MKIIYKDIYGIEIIENTYISGYHAVITNLLTYEKTETHDCKKKVEAYNIAKSMIDDPDKEEIARFSYRAYQICLHQRMDQYNQPIKYYCVVRSIYGNRKVALEHRDLPSEALSTAEEYIENAWLLARAQLKNGGKS